MVCKHPVNLTAAGGNRLQSCGGVDVSHGKDGIVTRLSVAMMMICTNSSRPLDSQACPLVEGGRSQSMSPCSCSLSTPHDGMIEGRIEGVVKVENGIVVSQEVSGS